MQDERENVKQRFPYEKDLRLRSPVFVNEGVEGHAVLPAGGEVCDVDVGIPAQQKPGNVFEFTQ